MDRILSTRGHRAAMTHLNRKSDPNVLKIAARRHPSSTYRRRSALTQPVAESAELGLT